MSSISLIRNTSFENQLVPIDPLTYSSDCATHYVLPNEVPPLAVPFPPEGDKKFLDPLIRTVLKDVPEITDEIRDDWIEEINKRSLKYRGWESVRAALRTIPREDQALLCPGTERVLFNAILAPAHCQLIIGRDISLEAVYYLHFTILVLRISGSRNELRELLCIDAPLEHLVATFQAQKAKILEKLASSCHISEEMKLFYSQNLDHLFQVYEQSLTSEKLGGFRWRNLKRLTFDVNSPSLEYKESAHSSWDGVDYWNNDSLFAQLQSKARNGQIIPTYGRIEEINKIQRVLGTIPIAAETSNIHNYQPISFGREIYVIYTELSSVQRPPFKAYPTRWNATKRKTQGVAKDVGLTGPSLSFLCNQAAFWPFFFL